MWGEGERERYNIIVLYGLLHVGSGIRWRREGRREGGGRRVVNLNAQLIPLNEQVCFDTMCLSLVLRTTFVHTFVNGY